MDNFPLSSACAFAHHLRNNFFDATRPARHPEWEALIDAIQTDQAFDARKISSLLRQLDPTVEFPPIVDPAAKGECVTIENASERCLALPPQPNHYIFKRFALPQKIPSLKLYRLCNVVFSYNIDPLEYYLFDDDGNLFDRLICGAAPFKGSPMIELEEPIVFADDIFPYYNICHLMFDKFPRVQHLCESAGVRHAFLVNSGDYVDQLMEAWGVKVSSLRSLGLRGSVRLAEAWFFSNSFGRIPHPGRFGSPVYATAFQACRDVFGIGSKSSASLRLFLYRLDGGPRSIVNIDAVKDLLDRWSIEMVDPSRLTLQEQITLFASTQLLIGVHGAGLTNMIYMPAGGAILELLPPLYATASYWGIASTLGIEYHHLVCHDPELGAVDARNRPHVPKNKSRMVEVPVSLLESKLSQLLC